MNRRTRRSLLFAGGIGLLFVLACSLWGAAQRRRDLLGRRLIAALVKHDAAEALRLIDAGADPNTPFTPPSPPSLSQWCQYLLHRSPLPVNDSLNAFLIASGSDLEGYVSDGPAASRTFPDAPELVQAMLQHGAVLEARDGRRYTPLHLELQNNHPRTVRILIEHGANIHAKDGDNLTPLLLAMAKSKTSPDSILLLLQKGADVNARDEDGKTPLILAFENELSPEVLRLLLEHHADVNARDNDGLTPLTWASYGAPLTSVRLLLQYGADVQLSDKRGMTPLLGAAFNPDSHVARLLLEHGADIKARNHNGETPLIVAVSDDRAKPETVRLLMAHGADIEAVNRVGDTPLLAACRYAPASVVRLLIDHGANVNAQEPYHETALYLLVLCSAGPEDRKAVEIIPRLLAHGADPRVISNHRTALQFARYARRPDLIAALQRAYWTK